MSRFRPAGPEPGPPDLPRPPRPAGGPAARTPARSTGSPPPTPPAGVWPRSPGRWSTTTPPRRVRRPAGPTPGGRCAAAWAAPPDPLATWRRSPVGTAPTPAQPEPGSSAAGVSPRSTPAAPFDDAPGTSPPTPGSTGPRPDGPAAPPRTTPLWTPPRPLSMITTRSITTVRWGQIKPSQPAPGVSHQHRRQANQPSQVGPDQSVTPGPNQAVTFSRRRK